MERNVIHVRGAQASVSWGYHVAMTVTTWSFTGSSEAGGTMTATVANRNAFRLSQRPLLVEMQLDPSAPNPVRDEFYAKAGLDVRAVTAGATTATWPVVSLVEDGATVTIEVGPKETR